MTLQLSVNYENRDAADLALMHLRQGGVAFSVLDITSVRGGGSGSGGGQFSMPAHANSTLALCQADAPAMPGVQPDSMEAGHRGGEAMRLKVRAEHLIRAKDILTGCGGKNVRVIS